MPALVVMPDLSISLNPIFLNHLRGIVETVSRSLYRRPAVSISLVDEDDTELAEAWKSGLLLSLREDLEALSNLLLEFGAGDCFITLSDMEAEKLLRAASSLRLRLRESCFRSISEHALETGSVDFRSLALEDQRVYGVYLFLANLQEQLVYGLESEIEE